MINYKLPERLLDAEQLLQDSIVRILSKTSNPLISSSLLFNNLRLNPIIARLQKALSNHGYSSYLLWADAGATALAKRDMPDITDSIYSYGEFINTINDSDPENIILAISPQPFDYDQFQRICSLFKGRIIMINGKLEDTAVGIGTVGRERRKDFLYSWKLAFWLQPLDRGALLKEFENDWLLFRLDKEGYRFCDSFIDRPDDETIILSLQK